MAVGLCRVGPQMRVKPQTQKNKKRAQRVERIIEQQSIILDQQTPIEAARHQKWKDDIQEVKISCGNFSMISMKLRDTEKAFP